MYDPGVNPPESLDFGGSNMFFGNMSMYAGAAYPISTASWSQYNQRYASEFISSGSVAYFDFLWSVEFDNSNGNARIANNLKFADLAALITYINSNIGNASGSTNENVIVKCYARISSNIEGISKMYGINRFFSVLKGRRQYKIHSGTYYNAVNSASGPGWSLSDDFAADIWDAFTFAGFIDKLNPTVVANAKRGIWFPTSHNKIHGLLTDGHKIKFDNGENKGRRVFDWGSSAWTTVSGAASGEYSISDKKIIGLTQDGTAYNIFQNQNIPDVDYYRPDSLIRVYRVDYNNHSALYVKPIGVDSFITNYITNINNIRLYMIAYNGTNDLMPIIYRLDNIAGVRIGNMSIDVGFRVLKHHIITNLKNAAIGVHIGHTRQKSFGFFVGDGAGNISSLGVHVTPKMLTTGAKIKILVN